MDPGVWHQHAWSNRFQSLLLLTLMAGFTALVGWLLWGSEGLVAVATSMTLLLLFNPALSPQLLMRMYGARKLDRATAPQLVMTVEALAQRAGLARPPDLYYLPSNIINAFSAGRGEETVVALSEGLLRTLSRRELVAVLAHEISHIRAGDTWVMGVADLFSRLTSLLSLFGQLLLLVNLPLLLFAEVQINWLAILLLVMAPGLSVLAQLGLSRTREYDADLNAVRLTGDGEALASALLKIDRYSGAFLEQILWPGRGLPEPSWLRTHPPTEERVRRILALQPLAVGELPAAQFQPLPGPRHDEPRWHLNGLWY